MGWREKIKQVPTTVKPSIPTNFSVRPGDLVAEWVVKTAKKERLSNNQLISIILQDAMEREEKSE